ncbi:ApeI family dehydratase [Methylophilus sp.]|uniref:ApeI family dehydratase n=1 Tax=Methylophilus sp. TaxID=29541 RepID=UPI004034FAD5
MNLPEILAIHRESASSCRIDMRIQPELAFFTGHFPGLPILPGVVQLHWAMQYGQQYTDAAGVFLSMENIKFLAVVLPEMRLCLTLNWQADKHVLSFEYASAEKKYSAGRLLLGGI